MNISLKRHLYGFVRTEFLYDGRMGFGGFTPCVIFGVASQVNRALSFHVLLEDGSQFAHVPLHAICHKLGAPPMWLKDLVLWDCFGEDIEVTEFLYLRELKATVFSPEGEYDGIYVCSFDWSGNGYSDCPEQHKTMHLIALENGCYALQPNNRLRWTDLSFTEPFDEKPAYLTNTHIWRAEDR